MRCTACATSCRPARIPGRSRARATPIRLPEWKSRSRPFRWGSRPPQRPAAIMREPGWRCGPKAARQLSRLATRPSAMRRLPSGASPPAPSPRRCATAGPSTRAARTAWCCTSRARAATASPIPPSRSRRALSRCSLFLPSGSARSICSPAWVFSNGAIPPRRWIVSRRSPAASPAWPRRTSARSWPGSRSARRPTGARCRMGWPR